MTGSTLPLEEEEEESIDYVLRPKSDKPGKHSDAEAPAHHSKLWGQLSNVMFGSRSVNSETQDSFLVASVVLAASDQQQRAGLVKPSSASLDAVTGGALHNKGALFHEAMKDKAMRSILFAKLRKSYRAEGLEFFVCVLERNRLDDMKERAAATRTIVREFVLNDAKRQVNFASVERDRIIRACIEEDDGKICSDDFFSVPALESCKELIASKEFADFVKEFLKDRPAAQGSDGAASAAVASLSTRKVSRLPAGNETLSSSNVRSNNGNSSETPTTATLIGGANSG